jgi:hypothetical protein
MHNGTATIGLSLSSVPPVPLVPLKRGNKGKAETGGKCPTGRDRLTKKAPRKTVQSPGNAFLPGTGGPGGTETRETPTTSWVFPHDERLDGRRDTSGESQETKKNRRFLPRAHRGTPENNDPAAAAQAALSNDMRADIPAAAARQPDQRRIRSRLAAATNGHGEKRDIRHRRVRRDGGDKLPRAGSEPRETMTAGELCPEIL